MLVFFKKVKFLLNACKLFLQLFFSKKLMIPASYNLPDAYRGDSYGPILLRVKDADGNYISFPGSNATVHVKNKKNCAIILSWSSSGGTIEHPDDFSMVLKEKIGCEMGMPQGIYDYDVQVLTGRIMRTYLRGTISVIGDVTDVPFCECDFNGGSAVRLEISCENLMIDAFSIDRV